MEISGEIASQNVETKLDNVRLAAMSAIVAQKPILIQIIKKLILPAVRALLF